MYELYTKKQDPLFTEENKDEKFLNGESFERNNNDDLSFSFFKAPINRKEKKPDKTVSIAIVAEKIRTEYEELTEQLRKLPAEEQGNFKKSKFDFVTYSAQCSVRSKAGVTSRSNYLYIDIDNIGDDEQLTILKKQILGNFIPVMMCVSSRGKGLQVVCKIIPEVGEHDEYYSSFQNYFNNDILKGIMDADGNPLKIDSSCGDASRAAYLCHDKNVFVSEAPTVFGVDLIDTYKNFSNPKKKESNSNSKNNSVMETALKMIRDSRDGEKHDVLLKASRLVGGGIATGFINENEAIALLEAEISKKPIRSFEVAQKTIRDGIEFGKKTPIEKPKYEKKKTEYNYVNFPICLITGIFEDSTSVFKNILAYAVYKWSLEKSVEEFAEKIKNVLDSFKIPFADIDNIKEQGEALHNSIPDTSPKTGIKLSMLNDYYLHKKTDFQIVILCAFLALKSIIFRKPLTKCTNDYLLSRMAGFRSTDQINDLPATLAKYNNRYQLGKIKNELIEHWGLKYDGYYFRGFFVSFTMSEFDLIRESEKKRKKHKEKLARTIQAEIRKQVIQQLYKEPVEITKS